VHGYAFHWLDITIKTIVDTLLKIQHCSKLINLYAFIVQNNNFTHIYIQIILENNIITFKWLNLIEYMCKTCSLTSSIHTNYTILFIF
jgi:hypothetical protein